MSEHIQDKIKKAAEELVFTLGVKGWNMSDCAREAGITKRTLYKYIKSKEELVEKTLINNINDTQNKLRKVIENEKDYITGLNNLIIDFSTIIDQFDSRIYRSIFAEYPDIEAAVVDKRYLLASVVLEYLKHGQDINVINKEFNVENILNVLQAVVLYNLKSRTCKKEELHIELKIALCGILEKSLNE